MKKLLLTVFMICIILSLASCEEKYPPVESTAEEQRTVITLRYGTDEYEVKYELYRALFTSLRAEVDLGDDGVWSGENKNEYIEKINEKIIDYASEIYSAFNLCKKAGIDVYSPEFEDSIDEYIKASVEGGTVNGLLFVGFGGDYQKYLDSLKEDGVNYSVQRLLLRYSLAVDALSKHYTGNASIGEFGEIQYTENDIESFYYGEECVRVIYAFLSSDAYTLKRASTVRDAIATKSGEDAVANYIVGHTTALSASDVKFGLLIAKNNLDKRYFGEITESAFSIEIGQTSPVHVLNTGSEDGYVIMYRTEKNPQYLTERRGDVIDAYLENEFGKILDTEKQGFIGGAVFSDLYKEISHADIALKSE